MEKEIRRRQQPWNSGSWRADGLVSNGKAVSRNPNPDPELGKLKQQSD